MIFVPKPPRANVVGNKWVFKLKRHPDGSIERHKARLVVKGFTQQEGIYYSAIFSLVIKPTTIRVVLFLVVSKGWSLRQLDISNAFLNGNLTEIVYMEQPKGFIDERCPSHACELHESIYGLKQASRAWFQCLINFLLQHGLYDSHTNNSLFIFHHNGDMLYILVYVDDLILTGSSQDLMHYMVSLLSSAFKLRDIENLSYFLGIEVH